MTFNIIATVDQDLGIGRNNSLPWGRIEHDRNFFNELISGSIIIASEKTFYNSGFITKFSPGLINAKNKVLISRKGATSSFADAYTKALCKMTTNYESIFVIGGASIFREAMKHPHLSLLYLTEIQKVFNCDAFFPRFENKFKLTYSALNIPFKDFEYRHVIYQNVAKPKATDSRYNPKYLSQVGY